MNAEFCSPTLDMTGEREAAAIALRAQPNSEGASLADEVDLSAVYFNRRASTDVTSIEEMFVRTFERAADRADLYQDEVQQERLLAYVHAQHTRLPVEVLTFDVFDTVILRNDKCEPRRFWEIAHRQAERINEDAEHGVGRIEGKDIFVARIMATRASYRLRRAVDGCREGSATDIYRALVLTLGLPLALAERLLAVELEYEIQNTSRNPLALRLAEWAFRNEVKTALVSDMYLHASHIDFILTSHLGSSRSLFGELTSSADTVISKGSGRLFDKLAASHGVQGHSHLHFGDNARTDFKSALSRGWRACLLPVPLQERQAIEKDYVEFVSEISDHGLDLGAWIKSGI